MSEYIFDLDPSITRQSVSYPNRFGISLSGDLYLPPGGEAKGPYPALIIGAPYGGVKEQGPGVYANVLAQRGFAVLTFDPSYNGYSEGEPRRVSSPELFVEDFSAGVDFLGTRPFVAREKIGVIGICGSGGFGLAAAQVDRRIKAVATVSMYDICRMQAEGFGGSLSAEDRVAQLDAIAAQRYVDFETGRPGLTGRGAPLDFRNADNPVGEEFGAFYSTQRGYHPNSSTQFTQSSSMAFMAFPLLERLDWIADRPILLVMGETAHSRYFTEDVFAQASEPKELLVVPGAGHVDLYDRVDLIPFDRLERFFRDAVG